PRRRPRSARLSRFGVPPLRTSVTEERRFGRWWRLGPAPPSSPAPAHRAGQPVAGRFGFEAAPALFVQGQERRRVLVHGDSSCAAKVLAVERGSGAPTPARGGDRAKGEEDRAGRPGSGAPVLRRAGLRDPADGGAEGRSA